MSGKEGGEGELPEESLQQIRQVFELCDGEKKGYIVRDELRLVASQLSEEELNLLFDRLDSNQDGRIEFDEFVAGCASWFLTPGEEVESEIVSPQQSPLRDTQSNERVRESEEAALAAKLELQEAKSRIVQLESDLSDANATERALKSQLKFLQAQIQQAEEMNEQLLADLNDTKGALSKEQKDMRTVNALKKQVDHLEQEAAAQAQQLLGLQAAEQRLLGAKSKLFAEKCQLESKVMEAEGELLSAQQEMEALKREVKTGKSMVKSKMAVERELEALKDTHDELLQQTQQLSKQAEAVPSLLADNKRLLENFRQTEALLAEARCEQERLREELENAQYSGITDGQLEDESFGESLLMEVSASLEHEQESDDDTLVGSIADELADIEVSNQGENVSESVEEIPTVDAKLLEESQAELEETQRKLSLAYEEVKRLEGELRDLREQLESRGRETQALKEEKEREVKEKEEERRSSECERERAESVISNLKEEISAAKESSARDRKEWERERAKNEEKLVAAKDKREAQVSELQKHSLAEKSHYQERLRELEREKHELEVERSFASDRERQREVASKEHIEQLSKEFLGVNEEKKREQQEFLERIEKSNEEKIQLMQEINELKARLLREEEERSQLDAKYQDVCKKGQHYYNQAKHLHQQLGVMKKQETERSAREEELRATMKQQESQHLERLQRQQESEREAALQSKQRHDAAQAEAARVREATEEARRKEQASSSAAGSDSSGSAGATGGGGGKFAQLFANQREWNKTKPKASWALPGAASGTSGLNAPPVYQTRPPPVVSSPSHDPSVYDKINKHIFIAPAHHLSDEERRRRAQANSFLEKQLELAKKHMTAAMMKK